MSNSSRSMSLGRRSGTVTVIEEQVRRSAARKAQIVFYVAWAVTGLLAATVTTSAWHPVIALFAGAAIGLVIATVLAALVLAWPVLRAIWWWATEIITAIALIGGWIELAGHLTLPACILIEAAVFGIPALLAPIRQRIIALAWCVITRHRIRACFSEFIITNRYGSLPLIMWAQPTRVGERIWVWLRPGLALDDIQSRLDLIAVACWGSAATVEAASRGNSALIRLDIKRRDALTGTIKPPLSGLARITQLRAAKPDTPATIPTALDLPDIQASDITTIRPRRTDAPAPAVFSYSQAPADVSGYPPAPPTPVAAGNDVSDWI